MDSSFDLAGSRQHGVASNELVISWSTDNPLNADGDNLRYRSTEIFADWPMSHAKRVTDDNRKNPEYHCVVSCSDKETADRQKLSRRKIMAKPCQTFHDQLVTEWGSAVNIQISAWTSHAEIRLLWFFHRQMHFARYAVRSRYLTLLKGLFISSDKTAKLLPFLWNYAFLYWFSYVHFFSCIYMVINQTWSRYC